MMSGGRTVPADRCWMFGDLSGASEEGEDQEEHQEEESTKRVSWCACVDAATEALGGLGRLLWRRWDANAFNALGRVKLLNRKLP